ncbi:hypothetical protein TruAng_002273 [Truncatella angustata]|nr:hypothetical protein TruAng_002273 [Truncatella angustata]
MAATQYPFDTVDDAAAVANIQNLMPVNTNSVLDPKFCQEQIRQDAEETHIIVHHKFPQLVNQFLQHKRDRGTEIEKRLYGTPETWTYEHQVRRLIEKRALVFVGSNDGTMLRDGTQVGSLAKEWDRVGTDAEATSKYLKLEDYLSYDEMMLGSLIGVSGTSYFINDGSRFNAARPGKPSTFETRGLIVGLVGARYERNDRMDSVFCQPPAPRPRQHGELTNIFADFFGKTRRPERYFNLSMYKARIRIAIDLLLLEANDAAKAAGKQAYVHVVGLGLGVWQVDVHQEEAYVEGFMDALDEYGDVLSHIDTLNFSYIDVPRDTAAQMKATGATHDIDVLFTRRNPAAKLPPCKEEVLLVVSYAWDSNSFPGNEYWGGSLTASGDPAAAAFSTISELHNPVLNPQFLHHIKVLSPAGLPA